MTTKVLTINIPIKLLTTIDGNRYLLRDLLDKALKKRSLEHYYGQKITYTLRVNEQMYNEFKLGAELNDMSIKDFVCDLLNGVTDGDED